MSSREGFSNVFGASSSAPGALRKISIGSGPAERAECRRVVGPHPGCLRPKGELHPARNQPSVPSGVGGLRTRMTGAILSGMLDDGVSGLAELKRKGGSPWCKIRKPPCTRACQCTLLAISISTMWLNSATCQPCWRDSGNRATPSTGGERSYDSNPDEHRIPRMHGTAPRRAPGYSG